MDEADEREALAVAKELHDEEAELYGEHSGRWVNASEAQRREKLAYARRAIKALDAVRGAKRRELEKRVEEARYHDD